MSFAFPKPVPWLRTSSSVSGSDSDFDVDAYYYELLWQPGPDYDELIIPLSLYAFNRLSPSDQQEQLEELRRRHDFYVNVEDSDFIELFKKLTYSDQHNLLSNFLQKFKCERLISSFKKLDAEHRQQLIESMNHLAPEENFPDPQETEADFRLRRFTESFKRLEFTSQQRIVDYIQRTIFLDLGYPEPELRAKSCSWSPPSLDLGRLEDFSWSPPSEGMGSFDPEWIKIKLPYLQDKGAAAAAATTQGATSQSGGGRGQGTSTSTVR